MKTTMFKRVFAMLAVVVMLVSMFTVNVFAEEAEAGDATIDNIETTTTDTKISDCSGGSICTKLKEIYGTTSNIMYNTVASETCKYSTSVQIEGVQVTVYLSTKPTTGDVGVQMGEDGKLVVDGISSDDTSSWNQLFSRFKGIIVALTGVGTLVTIVLFIIQFMKLGASAGNPQARSQALTGVLWTGISAALLGSVTIIVGFFYNAI